MKRLNCRTTWTSSGSSEPPRVEIWTNWLASRWQMWRYLSWDPLYSHHSLWTHSSCFVKHLEVLVFLLVWHPTNVGLKKKMHSATSRENSSPFSNSSPLLFYVLIFLNSILIFIYNYDIMIRFQFDCGWTSDSSTRPLLRFTHQSGFQNIGSNYSAISETVLSVLFPKFVAFYAFCFDLIAIEGYCLQISADYSWIFIGLFIISADSFLPLAISFYIVLLNSTSICFHVLNLFDGTMYQNSQVHEE